MKVYAIWEHGNEYSEVVALYDDRAHAEAHLARFLSKHPEVAKQYRSFDVEEHLVRSAPPTWADLDHNGQWRDES